jgi:hypothetical protein
MDRVGGLVDDWRMGIPSGSQLPHQRDHDDAASRAAGQAVVREEVWKREARGPESGDSRSAVSLGASVLVVIMTLVADLPPSAIGVERRVVALLSYLCFQPSASNCR